jgi:cyclopropane fatty-acyl-phospholipid synthase-like methyltransferase
MQVPLTQAQLLRLAHMCQVNIGTRVLDLACGRGELLAQWARQHELQGTGVDDSAAAITLAQKRAEELEVWSQLQFVVADVLAYPQPYHQYNVIALLSATGLAATLPEVLDTLRQAIKKDTGGLLLVGEMFWRQEPTPALCRALEVERDWLETPASLVDQFTAAGLELVDMLLLTPADWDAYYAQQWRTCAAWLAEHDDDADAPALRDWLHRSRRYYLHYEREALGWGAFVVTVPAERRPATPAAPAADDDLRFDWQQG